jgi:Family of unknown function (DUF5974)
MEENLSLVDLGDAKEVTQGPVQPIREEDHPALFWQPES